MAPKRPTPADEQPPPAVSSDEESSESVRSEEEEEDEENESYDSDEPKGTQQKGPQPKPSSALPPRAQSKPQKPVSSSESESESESEDEPTAKLIARPNPKQQKSAASSESDSESDEPKGKPAESDSESDSDVTPVVAAKPVEIQGTPQSKKLNLKRPRSETTSAAEDAAKTPSKKSTATSRSSHSTGEESSKKTLFQRVWSEEDEIALLEGMIEFSEKRGVDPSTNINSFHEFIKDRLRFDVVQGQLVTKIRNCKKKFMNKIGKDRVFSRPNDQRAYDLSKKLWDSQEGIIGESVPKANGTATKKKKKTAGNTSAAMVVPPSPPTKVKGKDEMAETQHGDATSMSLCEVELSRFSGGRLNCSFLRRGLESINGSKREEMEKEWEKLQVAELHLQANRARLVQEHTNLIMNAYNKSDQ
ncbi:hypothetical protein CDL15_Pgr017035 [Punica granatum]|uniref:Glabrous enhancer-binding protein-like DBD domain-containing protein n=1 Tax=Punica granatum TaxID=22663 RepID=A0A218WXN4_PUNGR|nr:hypothetical protein CDL15_Pgr017035 [Punica granatum]PKI72965.1 hypothetical protein CRG98_006665 [Punica granatum]